MKKPIIELTDLDFSYNGLKVLSKINLTVYEGDFLAVLGPNAGGKTTLLKIMLGLLVPEKGLARVFGLPPGQASQRMGYVPQAVDEDHDFPISVFDVTLMGRLKRLNLGIRYSPKDKAAARQALEAVDMWKARDRMIGELSGGQRQRVYIARALCTEPDVLLFDEPTASVDAPGKHKLFEVLSELNKHMTIVMVSHDISVLHTSVNRVACVSKVLYVHDEPELTGEMAALLFGCPDPEKCPFDLVSHAVKAKILHEHEDKDHA